VRAVISFLVILALFGQAALMAQRRAWWRDPDVQRRLSLTASQVTEIDLRFRETLDERRKNRVEADKADAELTEALARGDLSDGDAEALAGRVAQLQAARNISRTRVLLKMYRVLTPEQRAQLAPGGSQSPAARS